MRDIKFRGKNKDIGWVYGQLAYDINGNTYIIQEVELDSSYGLEETMLFATMWYRVEKETAGQYTGLKDKSGKEIYEGDIVKSYFENGLGVENKCLIIYDEYLCAFMGQELRTKQQYLFNEGNPNKKDKQLKYTEVIGNIYDNKKLLEEGE